MYEKGVYGKVIEKVACPDSRLLGILFCPEVKTERSKIAVLVMHSDENYASYKTDRYSTFPTGPELAKRGFYCMNANMPSKEGFYWSQPEKMLAIKTYIEYLRSIDGVEKVVIMGHSGGATTTSAYQAIAENGVEVFQGPEKIVPHPDVGKLPPADGVMLLDPNWGNAICQLCSLDPAIVDERSGMKINEDISLYNEKNGFDPDDFKYTEEFLTRFVKAQGERNMRILNYALERYHAIERGEGMYIDDEPLVIPAAAQGVFNNKTFHTPNRFAHTAKPHKVIHGDGSIREEIAKTLLTTRIGKTYTPFLEAARIFTVKNYLTSYAIRTEENFGYGADSMWGVDWDSSYNSAVGNSKHIHVPFLVTGMTAGVNVVVAETVYNSIASEDKDLVYLEGSNHLFYPAKQFEKYPGQFGDSMALHHDYVAQWLAAPGRFI